MSEVKRNPIILTKNDTLLLVVDFQEKILQVIRNIDSVMNNTKKLIEGCKILDVPIFYTEQYPKGLGHTAEVLKESLKDIQPYEKTSFSCFDAGTLFKTLKESGRTKVVLCGIESHVCVQQTALDLLTNGFQVYLVADAVSSRKEMDYNIALRRMEKHGAEIITTESVLFEMLEYSGTAEFKAISKLVK